MYIELLEPAREKGRFFYSFRKVSDGLDIAAFIACVLTVIRAMKISAAPDRMYNRKLL